MDKVFPTLGSSNHSAQSRQREDFYATDPATITGLNKFVPLTGKILEPCCGNGALSKAIESLGCEVVSEDLYDHGFGTTGVDFLKRKEMPEDCCTIITNFPYKSVTECTLHALDLLPEGGILASFVKTTFLESKGRYDGIFKTQPPKYVLQFVNRQRCYKDGKMDSTGSSAVSYAWMVWEKGFHGNPVVKWID